jgi:uncharacterized protein
MAARTQEGVDAMLYRKLGRTDLNVSILGFGAMRLPIAGGSKRSIDRFNPNNTIDEEEAAAMVRYAIEHGVNYFDTAYPYHGGKSETFLGNALKGHRDRVLLATKLPPPRVQTQEDCERLLDEQLKKLDTGYLDVYLLHGLDRPRWAQMKDIRVFEFLDRIRRDGRVRHVGFSFHDELRLFKDIVDCYDWAVCQIQYNFFDEHYQAGREGLAYAASKGLGVVVMEPLRGGKLTERVPEEITAIWNSAERKRSPAAWALRWVWNQPEVSTLLSGMSSMAQMKENIEIAEDGTPNALTTDDLSVVRAAKDAYKTMLKVECTGCGYCMPCDTGVNIPLNLNLYNDHFMFKDPEMNFFFYNDLLLPEQKASSCIVCKACEDRCPQHLAISDILQEVHETLSRRKN